MGHAQLEKLIRGGKMISVIEATKIMLDIIPKYTILP